MRRSGSLPPQNFGGRCQLLRPGRQALPAWRTQQALRACHWPAASSVARNCTSPPASEATGRPSRNSSRLPVSAASLGPGVRMPARLADRRRTARPIRRRCGLAPHLAQRADRLGQRVLLAGEAGDEPAAADFAARLQPAIDAQQIAPRRQPRRPRAPAAARTPRHSGAAACARHARSTRGLAWRVGGSGGARRVSAQRPASSMPNVSVRRRRVAAGEGLRRSDGTSSARRPPKLSEVTRPSATSSAERLLDLRAQQAGRLDQLVEERGAVRAQAVEHRLRARARLRAASGGPTAPSRARACRRASSVIGVVRTGVAARSPPLPRRARAQPRPGDAPARH